MDWNMYRRYNENWWKSVQVRSRIPLRNGYCELPEGTVYRITRKLKGFNLESAPCGKCGAKQFISRVSPRDLDFVQEIKY